jgi:hypothetical protein
MKNIYFLFTLFLVSQFIFCQTTETFETEAVGSSTFTDNGQVFNISTQARGPFDIYYNATAYGWSGTANDNYFIDNSSFCNGVGLPGFTISTADATEFTLKSFYIYLSLCNSATLTNTGTITVTGKLGGLAKYTATLGSGISNMSYTFQNGFTYIDLSTLGGSDNSNTNIDEFVISTTGNYEYLALDAMQWDIAPLGIDSFENSSALSIYPNPTNGIFKINSNFDGDFIIVNQLGQTVKTFKVNSNVEKIINVYNLSDGIYFIKSINVNQIKTQRIIVKK